MEPRQTRFLCEVTRLSSRVDLLASFGGPNIVAAYDVARQLLDRVVDREAEQDERR